MYVKLTRYTKDPVSAIDEAASNCYDSTIKTSGKLMNQCFSSGHHAVLEFATFTFHIEGISRACLAQLSRHRLASLSVRSQRYVKESDIQPVIPPSIKMNTIALGLYTALQAEIENTYSTLLEMGIPAEDARYVLSNATPTTLELSMNLRELIHFCNLRLCCYDEETEFLTIGGWKHGKDLTTEDMMYTMDINNMLCSLINPIQYYRYEYCGEMVRVKGQSIDLMITPNHRNVVSYSWDNKKWILDDADTYNEHKMILMKKNCNPISGLITDKFVLPSYEIEYRNQYTTTIKNADELEVDINELMSILGFYISDGCCTMCNGHYTINFTKGDREVIEKYSQILKRITGHKTQVYMEKSGSWRVFVHSRHLYNLLKPLGKADEKHIPEFVWKYDHSILFHLYEGLCDGDFNKSNSIYTTISKRLADDMQRLALHLGWSATITALDRIGENSTGVSRTGVPYNITTKNICYYVNYNKSKNEPIIKSSIRSGFSMEKYQGYVYCVELPINHTLYVRRNGRCVWSGNSRAQWEIRDLAEKMRGAVLEIMPEAKRFLVPQCERNTDFPYCTEAKSCGRHPRLKDIYAKNQPTKEGKDE